MKKNETEFDASCVLFYGPIEAVSVYIFSFYLQEMHLIQVRVSEKQLQC